MVSEKSGAMFRSSPSSRLLMFMLLSGISLAVASGYVAWAAFRYRLPFDAAPSVPVASLEADTQLTTAIQDGGAILFLHLGHDSGYGKLGVVPIDAPGGIRSMSDLTCDRVHFAAGQGICLTTDQGIITSYDALLFDEKLQVRHKISLPGIPSRVRISPNGRIGAVTVFVSGHSYAVAGFSTRVSLIDMTTGDEFVDLEQFEVYREGRVFRAPDFNFWGVTFSRDSNHFYATLGSRGETYLVEGDIEARTISVLRENVECPSLSPDEKRLAFKKAVGEGGLWRFYVLDLATMNETSLAETQSVDDQVEWLDDDHILYGYAPDTWVVRADGTGEPMRFIPQGGSPAVIR